MRLRSAFDALRDSRAVIRQARLAVASHIKSPEQECPICGYYGRFKGFGDPVRTGAQCRKCYSLERHRLFALAVHDGAISLVDKDVLNFTADVSVQMAARDCRSYKTSNYPSQNGADFNFDIQSIAAPNQSFDVVICSHVLEHVDDRKAFRELYRILRPGGQLLFMVPIIEGWSSTYENPDITSPKERHIHFGQFDHVRYYGSDVRERATSAGFQIAEYTGSPQDCIRYGLSRGQKLFIATKKSKRPRFSRSDLTAQRSSRRRRQSSFRQIQGARRK